jgi:hypothetical protein
MTQPTLTNLTNDLHLRLDTISRELTGLIPAVARDTAANAAYQGQTITTFVTPNAAATDITPGQLPPDDGNQAIAARTMTIDKARRVAIKWSAIHAEAADKAGAGQSAILADQIEQAMRTLANEMEADLAAQYVNASTAVDPAGTTLFDAANYKDLANIQAELDKAGAPQTDRQLVLGISAAAAFIGNATNTAANTAGSDTMLRQGVLLDHFGMALRKSAQIKNHTKGTATSATTDDSGYAVGATVITLASAGTGTIVAGDIITFADDTTRYVVASGDADVSNGGTITLVEPGLRQAIPTSTKAITVQDDAERNMAFPRSAIVLATRLPAQNEAGGILLDSVVVTDPRSGLSFEVAKYDRYREIQYEVGAAWGTKVFKPEHLKLLAQ